LFLSFADPSGSGKTDQLCAARGRGGTFFFPSANPQLLSLYQWLAPSLEVENSSGQKHTSDTGQLICIWIIRITDNRRSVAELQDGC